MKKARKIAVLLLTLALTLAMTVPARAFGFANASDGYYHADARQPLPPRHAYASVTGTVVSVQAYEWARRIRVSIGEGYADFNINDNTLLIGEAPEIGDTVTGFYDSHSMMIMIYPPQYTVEVLVNHTEDTPHVFVGRFFEFATPNGTELRSADGTLRLNATHPETVLVSQGGQNAADWDLNGRLLAVAYTTGTRSLPPLVFAPEKIVVMYEFAIHPGPAWVYEQVTEYAPEHEYIAYDIVINGVGLPGETFYSADGIYPTHVPIRAIAEHLGITVNFSRPYVLLSGAWGDISFRYDGNAYTVNGETIVLADAALATPNERTQVPLAFFREIAGFTHVWTAGGTVFIE